MMKTLTEFLAAGLKTGQPTMMPQDAGGSPQNFADAMDELLVSATTGSQQITADEHAEKLVVSEQMEPLQNQPKTNIHEALLSVDSDVLVPRFETDGDRISPDNFQEALVDLNSTTLPSQGIVTNQLVESQSVGDDDKMANGSIESRAGNVTSYVEATSRQLPDLISTLPSTELSMGSGADQVSQTLQDGSEPIGRADSGFPNTVKSALMPTDITLNMVEAGRTFAGQAAKASNNKATVVTAAASSLPANPAAAATGELVGVENSLARTEGSALTKLLGVTERSPLGQSPERSWADPRTEAVVDRAAVTSSAAVVKTEMPARQPVSFDAGLKLSNAEPQQFAGDMATYVRALKSQSGGEVKLNLHPAELGRMSISVSTEGNETRVAFVVETSLARQAVETALPRLRDMLENAGLSLSDSDVSQQRDPQADSGERESGSSRGEPTSPDNGDVSATIVLSLTVDPDRLVDTYI